MTKLRTVFAAIVLVAACVPQAWSDHHQRLPDTAAARKPEFFQTRDGFYFHVERIQTRSGGTTAMVTLVSKEEFAVCSNEIAIDGTASDTTVALKVKGIHHPVRFYMDSRGPATGAFYLESPPQRFTLRIAYGDSVDVWNVVATDSAVTIEPVAASFTEPSAIWPPTGDSAVRGR